MQIYRAEDGEAFQVTKTLRDIEKLGSLELFLHEATGIDEAAVLAYLSDGRRLRHENIRELGGASDQSIFVFNKHNLDYELEDVLHKLQLDPPLQPEVEIGDWRQIEALATTGTAHYESIVHIFTTIQVQHEALRIASTSLDLNVLSISDAFEGFAGGGRRELEKQAHLLQGLEIDLEVIAKIRIHPEFLSSAVRKAVEAGEKARTLGDYVSNVKMRQVGEACAKTHNDLRSRFETAEESMSRLSSGADDVRTSIVNSGLVEEAELGLKRSFVILEKITEITTQLQEPRMDEAELLAELRKDDVALRDDVKHIADLKNKSTALCMRALRQISQLNNDLMFLPPALSALQVDFRAKTNFAHIQRLHNMLYAYGATLVEIVRRKEFSRFFTQRAQTIAEIMAKLSSGERKRRQIYRGEVHGQLPFDTKGLDESVPAMEINTTGFNSTSNYSIEREDLNALLDEIDKIEHDYWTGDNTSDSAPLRETRSALEKLINRMDNLEVTFDKMAEKTIFSASRASLPRRQATDHTDNEFQEVVEQLHELQDVKSEQERLFEEDRQGLHGEIDRLRGELRDVNERTSFELQRANELEAELHHVRTQREDYEVAHRALEEQNAELRTDAEVQRRTLADALADAVGQDKASEALRKELAKATSDLEEAKRRESDTSEKMTAVVATLALTQQSLEDTRARGMDLEAQLEASRVELEQAIQASRDTAEEKTMQLRAQALEADRTLRDVIAEADGDRAVLEHQYFETRAALESRERELKEAKSAIEVSKTDATGSKEELQRVEHALREARQVERVERVARDELRSVQSALVKSQTRLEDSERVTRELLQVAVAFRESHSKAFVAAQSTLSSSKSVANLADSAASVKPLVEPPPIDTADLSGALHVLQEYDLAAFNDAIAKTGSTIRKWQKQCKEYRDRAKGKISFRNFAKGDLALFLPTRNSISKPWAAFNVSFPHYFLQATGNLAEQLKTREWVVARITTIAERIADNRDPATNPYGLGDGTKFYMLQVEDWTQSSTSARRKPSPQKAGPVEGAMEPPFALSPVIETSPSASASPYKPEPTAAPPKHLLGPRQRTHSAPMPNPSSLSRLLAQGTPPIEEATERTTPSPPRLSTSRSPSPLAGPSHVRTLTSPSHSRPASPLGGLSHSRPSSPLRGPSYARVSPPLTSPTHARPVSPLASPLNVRPASPLGGRSHPPAGDTSPIAGFSPVTGRSPAIGPSPIAGPSPSRASPLTNPSPITGRSPITGPSPSQPSPKSLTSPIHPGSRRSSSSSRPSRPSSVFSPSRHPFALSSSHAKAAATTALSSEAGTGLPPTAGSSKRRETVTPSPEGSPGEGMASVVLARRRTTSHAGSPPSQSSANANAPGGALTSLANSWGATFGKRKTDSTTRSRTSSGATTRPRPASELLRRYDDILPQERGAR